MGRLVILSGPSCVGKGPLHIALKKFYPALAEKLSTLVLYNSRAPRPAERDGVDYHFRPRAEIEQLRKGEGYLVAEVRGDLQALELNVLDHMLAAGDVFFEGNPFIVREMRRRSLLGKGRSLSVFLSPLSREEIVYLKEPERRVCLPDFLTDVMRRKLLRRTRRQKQVLSLKDLENIEKRAASAYAELKEACFYDHVIANHDGEDSENWDAFYYPVGDARKALLAFAELLAGRVPAGMEKWEEDLLP